mmetsp:Transcript_31568/g.39581  ORF Transcript_31568/g.39581 Transcript_31568/m.39581 type:complete len:362 (+) Transcript_31568:377-1462(+)
MEGTLKITVLRGKSLRKRTSGGIYCALTVGNKTEITPPSKDSTSSPAFDAKYELDLKLWPSDTVQIQIMNKNKDSEVNIGEASVSLKEVIATCKEEQKWIELMDKDKSHVGKLLVSLEWSPVSKDLLDKPLQFLMGERHGYLRTGFYYDLVKGAYVFVAGLPVASSIAPALENTVDKVLEFTGNLVGIKEQPEEGPEEGGPETEKKKKNLNALDKKVLDILQYIDESIDGAKDVVVINTKATKDCLKCHVFDKRDKTTRVITMVKDKAADGLNTVKEKKDSAAGRLGDAVCAGYGYLQPWVAPVPVVGKLFKPLEEEAEADEETREEAVCSGNTSEALSDLLSQDDSNLSLSERSTSPTRK